MKMNPVIHFELPADDRDRMVEFYSKAFGWSIRKFGPEMGNYSVATTTESDDKGPKNPGAINGGFFIRTKETGQYPSIVISVDDINEAMKKITEAGGKILGGQKPGEPDDIPGIGLYIAFIDSEGTRVGILQPSR